jgi:glutaminyl-peptide cyclotransferase
MPRTKALATGGLWYFSPGSRKERERHEQFFPGVLGVLARERVFRSSAGHLAALVLSAVLLAAPAAAFDGPAALEATRKAVSFGPRPAGSPALGKMRQWLLRELRRLECPVEEDTFTASTPLGARAMTNVIAKFPGTSGRIIVVSGHYDTYHRPGLHFVGANDGGSSTGFLLELARTLARQPRKHSVWLVWLDGEESLVRWERNDHTYGSRHLAARWRSDGTLPKIAALLNVDMIGDADLELLYDLNSTDWLRDLVWSVASRLGYAAHFPRRSPGAIEDDHLPFIEAGVPAVDLIDFDFGPDNAYWHSERDTMDKLSPRSLEVVGRVVLETIRELERR